MNSEDRLHGYLHRHWKEVSGEFIWTYRELCRVLGPPTSLFDRPFEVRLEWGGRGPIHVLRVHKQKGTLVP